MAWLFSQLGWFWETFRWAGVVGVAILAWFLIAVGLFLLSHRRRDRGDEAKIVAQDASTPPTVQEQAPEASSEPLAWHPKGLYVGVVNVDAENMENDHVVRIIVAAFNATGRTVNVTGLSGHIVIKTVKDSNVQAGLDLPSPAILRERSLTEGIELYKEFTVILEQPLRPSTVVTIREAIREEQVQFTFDKLDILVGPSDEPSCGVRLPLWDGTTLSWRENMLYCGKLVVLRPAPIIQGTVFSTHG